MENTGQIIPVENGAEAFIEVLNSNSVDYIFMNPGTSSGSIQEALAKYQSLGKKAPGVITCLHEFVALSAAHGYYMVSGKPQVVLVHLALGTLQLGGSLLNAQRCRVGVVICSTRVPYGREGNKSGMPAFPLHWIHEEADQAAPVRDYVKWEYELRSVETLREVVQRAFRISTTQPSGPTYLVLPQDLLGEKITEVHIPPVERHSAVISPQLDGETLDKIAGMLIKAENPLIITGYSGRNPDSVEPLVKLAELLGIRIISSQQYMNFPTDHPSFAGLGGNVYLREADVILTVDCDIPYISGNANLRPDVKLIHLDIDPIKLDFPMWGFPADILAHCDSTGAFVQLFKTIKEKASDQDILRFQDRFKNLEKEYSEKPKSDASEKATLKPVSAEWLCQCINEAIDEDTIIVEETVTNSFPVSRYIERTKPGTKYNNQGASLGWGLGAALGAKLARPDKMVVSLVGDGTFIFGSPIATFWAAARYNAPFLCVVFNNGMYNAPRMGIAQDSYSAKTGNWVGTEIEPSPDYAAVGKACGGYGRIVEDG
ncbi:MAG TPA: thiamine pyrophosphate-requiring protein, partial [Dehalococcoidia bacterium]|nr:thiamine pyrophosphate-requiring protein [Dehalococcoidia bacterium]